MPKNKEAYIRYRVIDRLLQTPYPQYKSMDRIIQQLEDELGKEFHKSTVQKDIKAMREDEALGFLAPIKYYKAENGYYYSEPGYNISGIQLNTEEVNSINLAVQTLNQYSDVGAFSQFSEAIDKILKGVNISQQSNDESFIHFDKAPKYEGRKWLNPIIEAIKYEKTVEFVYNRYGKKEPKTHIIHPILLKEYRNRWYLVGRTNNEEGIVLIFGLGRMANLKINNIDNMGPGDFDVDEFFKYSFGITQFGHAPINVVLKFTAQQGNYIKSQPLHSSQKIISDTEEELIVGIKVKPTYELISQILSYGEAVEVLKPKTFRADIVSKLLKCVNQYS